MVDNIFSALGHRRTSGVIKEFVLWCVVCFGALLSLIAAAIGRGNITWIMLLLFSIGLGVLMAFRLRAIALLYSVGVFHFLTFMIHYVCFSGISIGSTGYSALNTVLFVLILLTSLALVICGFIHFFTRINLSLAIQILVITDSSVMFFLHILMYAAGYKSSSWIYSNAMLREALNARGYWIGTFAFWTILVVVVLYYIFFFHGMLGNRNEKIIKTSKGQDGRRSTGYVTPAIQGIKGTYMGQTVYMQGRSITIGSGNGVTIRIPDRTISQLHCQIRFDGTTGFYQLFDSSLNGVYLGNGALIPKKMWYSVQRGSIICIGGLSQQFRLL